MRLGSSALCSCRGCAGGGGGWLPAIPSATGRIPFSGYSTQHAVPTRKNSCPHCHHRGQCTHDKTSSSALAISCRNKTKQIFNECLFFFGAGTTTDVWYRGATTGGCLPRPVVLPPPLATTFLAPTVSAQPGSLPSAHTTAACTCFPGGRFRFIVACSF